MLAMFAQPDALPGAGEQASFVDREGQFGAEQAGQYVGGHVRAFERMPHAGQVFRCQLAGEQRHVVPHVGVGILVERQ